MQEISPIPSSSCIRRYGQKELLKQLFWQSALINLGLLAAKEKKKNREDKSIANKAKRASNLKSEKIMTSKKPATKKKKIQQKEVEGGDWYCNICEEKAVEDLIQCLHYKNWLHEVYAGVKPRKKQFICSECQ